MDCVVLLNLKKIQSLANRLLGELRTFHHSQLISQDCDGIVLQKYCGKGLLCKNYIN